MSDQFFSIFLLSPSRKTKKKNETKNIPNAEQLLATDILALATMKNAAKCDT